MIKLKNLLEGFNSRLKQGEERISKLEKRSLEIIKSEGKKRMNKSEQNLRVFWNTIKQIDICVMEVQEKRKKWAEKLFEEIMIKNIPNLRENMDLHIQKSQQIPSRKNIHVHLSKKKKK